MLDLYSGTGTIALSLAARSKAVIGVESNKQAVHDARFNAEHNGIDNARFLAADLSSEQGMAAVQREVPRPDVIIAGEDPRTPSSYHPARSCASSTLTYFSVERSQETL